MSIRARLLLVWFLLGATAAPGRAKCPPQILWDQAYNDPANGRDIAFSVAVDSSGYIFVGMDDNGSWALRKYAPYGELLWTAKGEPTDHGPFGLACDRYGREVVAMGYATRTDIGEGANWIVRKYDDGGRLLWSRTYDSPAHSDDYPEGVAMDAYGFICVAGTENRTDLGEGVNWRVAAYDSDGHLRWSRTHNSSGNQDDYATGVALAADGGPVVVGYDDKSSPVPLIQRYDFAGNLQWATSYMDGGLGWEDVSAVCLDSAGNIVVTGEVGLNNHLFTRKFDPAGRLIWKRDLTSASPPGPAGNTFLTASAVAADDAGGVVVAGSVEPVFTSHDDWLIARYDGAGNLLWVDTYASPGGGFDAARGIGWTGRSTFVVAGAEYRGDLGQDYNVRIRKYFGPPCGKAEPGHLLIAPNVLALSGFHDYVDFIMHGDAGASVEVMLFDEAGRYIRSLRATLDSSGAGVANMTSTDAVNWHMGTGVYWAKVSGGGIDDRRAFTIVRRRFR